VHVVDTRLCLLLEQFNGTNSRSSGLPVPAAVALRAWDVWGGREKKRSSEKDLPIRAHQRYQWGNCGARDVERGESSSFPHF